MDVAHIDILDKIVDVKFEYDKDFKDNFINELQDDCKTFIQSVREPIRNSGNEKDSRDPKKNDDDLNFDFSNHDLGLDLDLGLNMGSEDKEEYHKNNKIITRMTDVLDAKETDILPDFDDDIDSMIEEILDMRNTLELNGEKFADIPEDLDSLPLQRIQRYYKITKKRYDNLTYSNMSSTIILGASEVIEKIFNGNRSLFGTRVNMVNFTDSYVRNRLPTLKKMLTKSISNKVKEYGISDGVVIACDIIPAAIHYGTSSREPDGSRRGDKVDAMQSLSKHY